MMDENQNDTRSKNGPVPKSEHVAEFVYDVSRGKADPVKRIVAAIIDAVIATLVSLIPVAGWIIAPLYWLLRDGMEIDFMDHRSVGKKLTRLRPVTMEGRKLGINDSIKRNWIFVLGGLAGIPIVGWFVILPIAIVLFLLEIILVLADKDGRRFGDKLADTIVIEVDN
ncbi:MAG TPA: RDD family protein [Acidobacteriota bacterium]|nr:RDD family protein [Acidobacteriota bacterium]